MEMSVFEFIELCCGTLYKLILYLLNNNEQQLIYF